MDDYLESLVRQNEADYERARVIEELTKATSDTLLKMQKNAIGAIERGGIRSHDRFVRNVNFSRSSVPHGSTPGFGTTHGRLSDRAPDMDDYRRR